VKSARLTLFIFLVGLASLACSDKYCPTYSTYEYNKDIVKAKSYKAEDAKAKRKMKKYNPR